MSLLTAAAGTVHFGPRGELVWLEDGSAVVFDSVEDRFVAAGAWSELADTWEAGVPEPEPCYPDTEGTLVKGEIVARYGSMCLLRHGSILKAYSGPVRRWRAVIPDWWGDRYTQVVFDASMALLYDGRTALRVASDGTMKTWDVGAGHGAIALHGDKVAFSGRPDIVLDLFREQIVSVGPLDVSDVRWRGGTVVGSIAGHAVVWDDAGDIRFVLDEPDYGQRRLSDDGRELGMVFVRESVRVGQLRDTRDGEVLGEWEVCADGNRIWPVGSGQLVDLCADEVWLRGGDGERVLARIDGLGDVSHVSLAGKSVRVVSGDGSHGMQVWRLDLDAGKAVEETWEAVTDGSRKVTGYDAGSPIALEVEAVHGRPVEVATARAFRKMERAAAEDGVELRIASGYRTWQEQHVLYECYLSGDCNGGNLAARPGFSNHQSGLALDLNTHVPKVRSWLRRHAHEYGFAATVSSEPWHWEYLGGERRPALAAALLPPAEPLHTVPRTPWTPLEREPEPPPKSPAMRAQTATQRPLPVPESRAASPFGIFDL